MKHADGRPYVRRQRGLRSLQFKGEVTQSRMWTLFPHLLQVDYTRTMLAALLLQPRPQCIGIVGLGGGSQAKFCFRYLPQSRIEAIEADAGVLALRDEFRIPRDGGRFRATHGDAAQVLKSRCGAFDLILLDAYDAHGIPQALTTREFFADCRAALGANGVVAINLYDTQTDKYLRKLRGAFAGNVVVLDEAKQENAVAFAWTGDAERRDVAAALQGMPWLARRQLGPGMRRLRAALQAQGL